MYRDLKLTYSKEVKKAAGRKALRFSIDDSTLANSKNNPDNDVFYSYKYDGTLNITAISNNSPIFLSRLYLHKVGQGAQDQVTILDDVGMPVNFNENTDDFFMDLESVTGGSVKVNFDIQTNIYLENSPFFETGSNRLLPMFVVRAD